MPLDAAGDHLAVKPDLEDAALAGHQRRIEPKAFAQQRAASLARFS